MEGIIIIALAVASVSFTITVTSLFSRFREIVGKLGNKWEEWIHCPYCFAHYPAAFIIIVTPSKYLLIPYNSALLNLALNLFAVMGLVALIHYVMIRAYKPIAELAAHRQLEKVKEQFRKAKGVTTDTEPPFRNSPT